MSKILQSLHIWDARLNEWKTCYNVGRKLVINAIIRYSFINYIPHPSPITVNLQSNNNCIQEVVFLSTYTAFIFN